MKTKTIKKLNIGLVVVLLSASLGLGATVLFVQWENGEFDKAKLAGKAMWFGLADESPEEASVAIDEESCCDDEIAPSDKTQDQAVVPEREYDAANEPAKFRFVAIGDAESYQDNTGYNGELVEVLRQSKKYNPDFALFTGDIISASASSDMENRARISNLKTILQQNYNNYYIVFGKHDVECGQKCVDFWQEIFFGIKSNDQQEQTLYHSFDYLNTHFVLLSTDYPEKHTIDEQQIRWLEEDLSRNKKPNTVVAQHVPPVTFFKESAKECHDMSCDDQTRQKLLALFKKYEVDLVISGHENAFDHKIVDGVDFVLSGQAGNKPRYKNVIKGDIYTLFMVEGEKIELEAINTRGEIIRTISIK